MRRNLRRTAVVGVIGALGLFAMGATAWADELDTGQFAPFAAAAPGGPYADAYQYLGGEADMVRNDDGSTTTSVDVTGLDPGVEYPVHVHNMACDTNEAGAHYKADPNGPSEPPNEIWPGPVTADEYGEGIGSTDVPYTAGDDARSVVVHAPDGQKIGCADLQPVTYVDEGAPPQPDATTTEPAPDTTQAAPEAAPAELVPTQSDDMASTVPTEEVVYEDQPAG